MMKMNGKKLLTIGMILLGVFVLWTYLIQTIDVQPVGQNGTDVGFATVNTWFHRMTGVHMTLYTVTDWLGLVPMAVCMGFGGVGLVQLIRRKHLLRVDGDILLLGIYYILVILGYLLFEMIPINYRPVLIDGHPEASYPSSTALLVLSVMPTLSFRIHRRIRSAKAKAIADLFVILFSAFMVFGRMLSGVHWLTDIIGSVLLSAGLYLVYHGCAVWMDQKHELR